MMENNDKELWTIAKRRAMFKRSLAMYFLVNSFLCAVWFITIGRNGGRHFWPIWPILGWGLGIAIQYANAYTRSNFYSVEKEYEKLKKDN
jgi:hypothetical protein